MGEIKKMFFFEVNKKSYALFKLLSIEACSSEGRLAGVFISMCSLYFKSEN
jgi:hypothetical protein